MVTFNSIVLRYNDRFKRWYAYTDTGLLIYFDLSLCPESDQISSGSTYKLTCKLMPSPKTGEGCPIAIALVVGYAAV